MAGCNKNILLNIYKIKKFCGKIEKNEKIGGIYMKTDKVMLENSTGLHARPATILTKIASKYPCSVTLISEGKEINAKSPLMIMSAGIKGKTEIEIRCDGEGEEEALNEIVQAFKNNFGE